MDPEVKIAIVDWVDSAGKSGWDDPEAHQKLPPYRCRSVGFLVRNDDTSVIVAQSLTCPTAGYEDRMADSIVIPKAAVQKVEIIGTWTRGG